MTYHHDALFYKFTGKERDSESNLDYFGARHYSSNLCRFSVPDNPLADLSCPLASRTESYDTQSS